jgi:hypothetical protein
LPNTLGHIGIQLPFSRLVFKDIDIPWMFVGILIPDIPWILQRVIRPFQLFDIHDLKLYVSVQASLLFCFLLAATLSCFSPRPLKVFGLLACSSLMHLLLDASQIKWGMGVHLLAPFSWQTTSFGFYWPEDPISYFLTGLGLLALAFAWKSSLAKGFHLKFPKYKHLPILLPCLLLYYFAPLFLISGLEDSNYAYLKIQRNRELRPGEEIILDRAPYSHEKRAIYLNNGEEIQIKEKFPEKATQISFKGTFTSEKIITITELHEHIKYRDWASRLGLFLTAVLCLLTWISFLRNKGHKD